MKSRLFLIIAVLFCFSLTLKAAQSRMWETKKSDTGAVAGDCSGACDEDTGILLTCSGPGKPVKIDIPYAATEKGKENKIRPLSITIDGETTTYQAKTVLWGLVGYLPSIELAFGDPLFEKMAAGKKMSVIFNGQTTSIGLNRSRKALAQFHRFCKSAF